MDTDDFDPTEYDDEDWVVAPDDLANGNYTTLSEVEELLQISHTDRDPE